MANPQIKLKRSSTQNKRPTPDNVPLGELALNTYDGYLYASKNVGVGTTVITVNPWRVGTGTDSYDINFTAGNVGINSASPTALLDVNGDVNVSGVITATSFSGDGSSLTGIAVGAATTITLADESSDTICYPIFATDATGDQNLKTDASNLIYNSNTGALTAGSFFGDGSTLTDVLSNISEDTSPQLGGNLDINSNNITGTGNIDITGNLDVSGIASVGSAITMYGSTGIVSATEYYGDGSNLSSIVTQLTAGTGISINQTTGNITVTATGGGGQDPTTRTTTRFVATASQSSFTVSYNVGYVDVFLNGSKLDSTEYTATNGTSISLTTAAAADDIVEIVAYESVGIVSITSATQGLDVTGHLETDTFNSSGIVTAASGIDAIGIQSGGVNIADGVITALNFIGAGNTFALNGTVVDISIAGGGGGGSVGVSSGGTEITSDTSSLNFIGTGLTITDDGTTTNIYIPTTSRTTTEYTATAGQTTFSGLDYNIGLVDVYLNGSKLDSTDFTATNGTSVVLTTGASVDDRVVVVSHKGDNFVNTIGIQSGGENIATGIITALNFIGAGNTFALNGTVVDISIAGGGGGGISSVAEDTTPQLGGDLDLNSSDITGTGNMNVTGVITATSFVGDGSNLTGIVTGIQAGANITVLESPAGNFIVTSTAAGGGGSIAGISTTGTSYFNNIDLSGDIVIADKIIHRGDTNTAIRFPADDTISLQLSGSERLRVNSLGRIGIGTTNPYYKIDFGKANLSASVRIPTTSNNPAFLTHGTTNNTDNTILRIAGTSADVVSVNSSYGFSVNYMGTRAGNNNSLSIFSDNQTAASQIEAITIQQDGSVGLNSTTPTARLDVNGDANVTGVITATNIVSVKSDDGTSGRVDLYCESANAHYARIQAPAHSDFSGNVTLTLPSSTGTLLLADGDGSGLSGIVTNIQAGSNITVLESPSGNFIITATGGGGGGISSVAEDTTPQLGGTLDTNGNLIQFGDSSGATDDRLQFGASQDLEIYHDGSNSIINDNGTGELKLQRGGLDRLTLSSTGVDVNLNLNIKDDYSLKIGDDGDLWVYETASDVAFLYNGTGTMFMRTGGDWKVDKNGSKRIYAHSAGAVDLYYSDSKKLETTNTGITVTGAIVKSGGTSSQYLMADGSVTTSSGGGGSSGIEIENNGTSVGTGITAINFSTNVTATASGGIATITASGSGIGGNPVSKSSTETTATAGQTVFNGTYTVGFVDVYLNGSKLSSSEFTATNGTSITLTTGATVNDIIEVIGHTFADGSTNVELSTDSTPELSGNLDLKGFDIVDSVGGGTITATVNGVPDALEIMLFT